MKVSTTEAILVRSRKLKLLVIRLSKQSWMFPSTVAAALRRRRRQAALDAAEAERLDRIRNPSDYLGKGS